jgi:hypothetical protein
VTLPWPCPAVPPIGQNKRHHKRHDLVYADYTFSSCSVNDTTVRNSVLPHMREICLPFSSLQSLSFLPISHGSQFADQVVWLPVSQTTCYNTLPKFEKDTGRCTVWICNLSL